MIARDLERSVFEKMYSLKSSLEYRGLILSDIIHMPMMSDNSEIYGAVRLKHIFDFNTDEDVMFLEIGMPFSKHVFKKFKHACKSSEFDEGLIADYFIGQIKEWNESE